MTIDQFKNFIQDIVVSSCELKDTHTEEKNAAVNYVAVFAQNDLEYKKFIELAKQIGKVTETTKTGDLFVIDPIDTKSGKLQRLKVRMPDKTRPERGDADFTVADYQLFKQSCPTKIGFSLIERDDYELIELIDPAFDVRTYFS